MSAKVNYLECNQSQLGTGVLPCEIKTGVPYGFFRTAPGWRFNPATEDFNDAYITEQIKAKNLIPFLNPIGFDTPDDGPEVFTSNLKVKVKILDSLPEFSFDYSLGRGFHKAAYSFNSFGGYGILKAFNNGVIEGALDGTGKIKGYNAGMFDTNNYRDTNGTDPQKTTIMFQLTDAVEYNTDYALLDGASNGFSLATVGGVIDTVMTKESNNAADVVLSVVAANNTAVPVAGLVVADFVATGTTATIDTVVYDAVTKQYTLTFSADVSGDYADLGIALYDSNDSTNVILKGVTLYQGSTS